MYLGAMKAQSDWINQINIKLYNCRMVMDDVLYILRTKLDFIKKISDVEKYYDVMLLSEINVELFYFVVVALMLLDG